jgi:membrane fusion protein (multidrug efflux system)
MMTAADGLVPPSPCHERLPSVPSRIPWRFAAAAGLVLLSACGPSGKGRPERGPPQAGFVVARPASAVMTTELNGRVTAFQMSEVRPQVEGVILRRAFTEGAMVRQGQTLYEIDPRVYRASRDQAAANLAAAEANAEAARVRAERLRPLAAAEAVSQQDYTDAAATARQTAAAVAQMRAQLATATVNLGFTRVPAPISGRIGRSLVTEGALVTANQAGPLAYIQRLDPVFVDIQQSSSELLALRQALAAGGAAPGSAEVELILEDGSRYAPRGRVQFSEVMVNEGTGTVTLRASFPNPAGLLLPGMFVRARFAQQVERNIFLVPQAALTRDPTGKAFVHLVGDGDKAVERPVVAVHTQGQDWVVRSGLSAGDRVIVQGLGNIRPGMKVRPVPASAPQRVAAPPAGRR